MDVMIDTAMRQSLTKEDSFLLAVADIQSLPSFSQGMLTGRTDEGDFLVSSLCSSLADMFKSPRVPMLSPVASTPLLGAGSGAPLFSIKARANAVLMPPSPSSSPSEEHLVNIPAWMMLEML